MKQTSDGTDFKHAWWWDVNAERTDDSACGHASALPYGPLVITRSVFIAFFMGIWWAYDEARRVSTRVYATFF